MQHKCHSRDRDKETFLNTKHSGLYWIKGIRNAGLTSDSDAALAFWNTKGIGGDILGHSCFQLSGEGKKRYNPDKVLLLRIMTFCLAREERMSDFEDGCLSCQSSTSAGKVQGMGIMEVFCEVWIVVSQVLIAFNHRIMSDFNDMILLAGLVLDNVRQCWRRERELPQVLAAVKT